MTRTKCGVLDSRARAAAVPRLEGEGALEGCARLACAAETQCCAREAVPQRRVAPVRPQRRTRVPRRRTPLARTLRNPQQVPVAHKEQRSHRCRHSLSLFFLLSSLLPFLLFLRTTHKVIIIIIVIFIFSFLHPFLFVLLPIPILLILVPFIEWMP